MGYNTTVVVLNDALDQIKKDPSFGKNLAAACSKACLGKPVDVHAGNHGNAATVIETHHADISKLIVVGGNYGEDLGAVWLSCKPDESKELQLARALADELGYDLHRKRGYNKGRRNTDK